MIITIYRTIIFLFMSDLSISISCQVSSLGVVTCGCHTTAHLRCNGEVLPETHGTHLLEADFLSQNQNPAHGFIHGLSPKQNLSTCGLWCLWESTQIWRYLSSLGPFQGPISGYTYTSFNMTFTALQNINQTIPYPWSLTGNLRKTSSGRAN